MKPCICTCLLDADCPLAGLELNDLVNKSERVAVGEDRGNLLHGEHRLDLLAHGRRRLGAHPGGSGLLALGLHDQRPLPRP